MDVAASAAPTNELYAAAIDMTAWVESRGAVVAWPYLERAAEAATGIG